MTDQSRPVDPGQLTSRLLDLSSDRDTSPRSLAPTFERESSQDTLPPIPCEELEKESYKELIEEGGRPFFDISLIDDIAEDPFSHWDLVRPWAHFPADCDPDPESDGAVSWRVFALQLWHWRMFRDWQKFNRDDFARWDATWGELRGTYESFDFTFRHRCPTYTDAVKKLLAEYDFTRPLVKRRISFVVAFKRSVATCRESKLDVIRHNRRLSWALEQVPVIEAELDGISPDASRGTKRRLEHDEPTYDRTQKKQRRDAGERSSTLGCNDGLSYQKAKPKRSRDDAANAADAGPPLKRLKLYGEDMHSHIGTWDGVYAPAGDSHEFAETGRPPSDYCLQRRRSTRHACQAVTSSQPLRRSARVAVRTEANRPGSRSAMLRPPQPPTATATAMARTRSARTLATSTTSGLRRRPTASAPETRMLRSTKA